MTEEDNSRPESTTRTAEGILDPTDLDVTADERVTQLDDGRLVVSTDDGPPLPSPASAGDRTDPERTRSVAGGPTAEVAAAPEAYVIDLAVKTDSGIDHERFGSNDIRAVFGEALRWYATRVAPETPPEAALDVLLEASLD